MSTTDHPRERIIRDYTFTVAYVFFCAYLQYLFGAFFFLFGLVTGVCFLRWRKEIYLLWASLAPRINGDLIFTATALQLVREEAEANGDFKDIVRLDIPFAKPIFIVTEPSYIKRILSVNADAFYTCGGDGPLKTLFQGAHNIFLAPNHTDPLWKRQRELTSPINKDRFGDNSFVAGLFRSSYKTLNTLSEDMKSKYGKPLDIFHHLFHMMVTVNNVNIFGEDLGFEKYPGLTEEIYKATMQTGIDLISPTIFVSRKTAQENLRRIEEVCNKVKTMLRESTSPLVMHMKAAVREKKISQDEVDCLTAVLTYGLAPLHAIFWVFYNLAKHPEVQRRLAQEIQITLANGPLTYTRMHQMSYLAKVVSETLRIFPAVALMPPRVPFHDMTFGPHLIPQGSSFFIFPYICHRNPKYWKDPEVFNPEREGLDITHSGSDLTFFPFGYGPRMCQGQFYAETLVKTATVTILSRHTLQVADGEPQIHGEEVGFCAPNKNINFIVGPREQLSQEDVDASSKDLNPPEMIEIEPPKPKTLVPEPKSKIVHQSKLINQLISQMSDKKADFDKIMLVLYGSQSGKSREFAERLAKVAELTNVFVNCKSISDFKFEKLSSMDLVVVVTSTYGHGEPPENSIKLYDWLNQNHPEGVLKKVKYAVLKIGSSVYPNPFAFGTFVDSKFKQLGAQRVIPSVKIDEVRYSDEQDFAKFVRSLFEGVKGGEDTFIRSESVGVFEFNPDIVKPKFKLIDDPSSNANSISRGLEQTGATLAEVLKNDKITTDPNNEVFMMVLKNSNNSQYEPGDELSVWPNNSSLVVDHLITKLGFDPNAMFRLEPEGTSKESLPSWGSSPTNLRHALSYHLDINSVSPSLLKFFALHCKSNPAQQHQLLDLAGPSYANFVRYNLSPADLLEQFEGIQVPKDNNTLAIFLGLLKPLAPRCYSISSSPKTSEGVIKITYRLIKYKNRLHVQRQGVASSFLATRVPQDTVAIKILPSTFHLPADPTVPVIMIGAGTGVSPFIGFVEERRHQLKASPSGVGKSVLIYGCSSRASMIGKGLWEKEMSDKVLDDVIIAFSQESEKKIYVQDQIEKNFDNLWSLIEGGACIYSCGDVKVGMAVKERITKCVAAKNNWTMKQASNYIQELQKGRRYQRSEWGLYDAPQKTIMGQRLRLWIRSFLMWWRIQKKH